MCKPIRNAVDKTRGVFQVSSYLVLCEVALPLLKDLHPSLQQKTKEIVQFLDPSRQWKQQCNSHRCVNAAIVVIGIPYQIAPVIMLEKLQTFYHPSGRTKDTLNKRTLKKPSKMLKGYFPAHTCIFLSLSSVLLESEL